MQAGRITPGFERELSTSSRQWVFVFLIARRLIKSR